MPHTHHLPHGIRLAAFVLASACMLTAGPAASAHAQSGGGYDLSWNTRRCGGGASSAGDYRLVSTLGIAEAGSMSAGAYLLHGGFLVQSGISPVGVRPGTNGPPEVFALHVPVPNPFIGATRLDYDLPKSASTLLAIYDVSGRRVRGLVRGSLPAGRHQAFWDGRDDGGLLAAPGVYLVRFETSTFRATRRVVHLN